MMHTIRDEAMTQMLLSRLRTDQRVSGQPIDIMVSDGDIILVGYCDSEDQRTVAEMIVQGAYGVRAVIDNIRVRRIAQAI